MTEYLFNNEQIITESGDRSVTLTTHRIRYYQKNFSFGRTELVSIMLSNISSIGLKHKSKPIYLILGILAFIVAGWLLFMEETDSFLAPAIAGLFLLLFYFFTRKATIAVASTGGDTIYILTKYLKLDDHLKFINRVEENIEAHRLMSPIP